MMNEVARKVLMYARQPSRVRQWVHSRQQRRVNRRIFESYLRPTDVFLVGHPKSGNTWLAYMLAAVLEKRFGNKRATLANVRDFIPGMHARDKEIALYENLPEPRIFRNEAPLHPEAYPKTIYIMRDPRAALVSYYHHCIHDTGQTDWPIESFVDEMLTQGCIKNLEPYLLRWDRHVGGWLQRARRQPVHFVKYEDMIRDRRSVLEGVLQFIGIECDDVILEAAVQRGTFENMRDEEKKHGAEPYSGTRGEGGYFVRRGKIDGWRDELSDALVAKIEKELGSVMNEVGYEISM